MALQDMIVDSRRNDYDVYIGRGTKWENPFMRSSPNECIDPSTIVQARQEAQQQYRDWLCQQPHLLAELDELRGKTLGVFGSTEHSHAEVLLELIEQQFTPHDPEDYPFDFLYAMHGGDAGE